jgi:hypothetical protein
MSQVPGWRAAVVKRAFAMGTQQRRRGVSSCCWIEPVTRLVVGEKNRLSIVFLSSTKLLSIADARATRQEAKWGAEKAFLCVLLDHFTQTRLVAYRGPFCFWPAWSMRL